MELLSALGIDWGMLIAQLINYGVLLIALTVLLYRPVLKLLDERTMKIKQSMEDAKKLSEQLKDMEKQQSKAMKELDAKGAAILAEAKKQAEHSKADIVKAAQTEADAILKKSREQLEDERRRMVGDLEKTVASLSVKLTGKILQREFSDADQKRVLASLEKDIPALIK